MDTTRIDRNKWSPPLVGLDWSALCQTLYDGVAQEHRESVETAKKVGIKKDREAHESALEAEREEERC